LPAELTTQRAEGWRAEASNRDHVSAAIVERVSTAKRRGLHRRRAVLFCQPWPRSIVSLVTFHLHQLFCHGADSVVSVAIGALGADTDRGPRGKPTPWLTLRGLDQRMCVRPSWRDGAGYKAYQARPSAPRSFLRRQPILLETAIMNEESSHDVGVVRRARRSTAIVRRPMRGSRSARVGPKAHPVASTTPSSRDVTRGVRFYAREFARSTAPCAGGLLLFFC